ncbi:helix-turn-helix domain-containing protein [Hymenobacter norwichensis]|uniref:helix-turn-helix domain-containing protein n=1 Tax=Hymenobacter norwichensis TaxID=223903 RepID=UPI00040BD1C2|nr:helix-turn-helix domain-containing protein [Hymenobacter norwichensis]
MQAYSLDLRQRVAQACAEPGARQAQVAQRFCVSGAFVGNLLRRQRQTGQVAALPGRGGPPRCLSAAAQAWLVAQVERQPDATLAELRDGLLAESGQCVSLGAVWRVLDEHGLRRKKKPARH